MVPLFYRLFSTAAIFASHTSSITLVARTTPPKFTVAGPRGRQKFAKNRGKNRTPTGDAIGPGRRWPRREITIESSGLCPSRPPEIGPL
ncbi:hypothetical protein GWI33_014630 [Rhynchophorus ferrugineus]|uniref:Uncharacterized protein n=1 Tax=Rhynchophorus ferrugineus TaxID=354439 RepID=A0A834I6S4_RHYFE|nr:hypothetical protein GWI33_014630 [Rhynchophorus ferrugineus]